MGCCGVLSARSPRPAGRALRAAGWTAAAGAAGLFYGSVVETRWFALRRVDVAVLPVDADPIRVLHLTDLHLRPAQQAKRDWIRSLAGLRPDLVIDTGDNLAHAEAVPALLESLGPLLDIPGVFVLGSNDYFSPSLRNPVRYLLPDDGTRHVTTTQLPWRELKRRLSSLGWRDLTNTTGSVRIRGMDLAFTGVDDPHLEYDDLAAVAGPADVSADLRIGVTHAPYLRVLDQFARDGHEIIFAGHTHGGQLRLPGKGAIVTNCDLEPERARGLHRHPAASPPWQPRSSWLHVSAGLGASPYAPVRFCCRPEATLLTLLPRAI